LPSAFTDPGAVFEAGATFFFAIFDVVITSFFSVFRSLWFLPLIHVLLVPGYTLCPCIGILNNIKGDFYDQGTGNAPGM
jgi:hypothetical protein